MVVNRSWITVPEDVRTEGTVYLTGVIHPIAQSVGGWIMEQHFAKTYGGTHLDILAYDDSTADDIARTAIRLLRRVLLYSGQARA